MFKVHQTRATRLHFHQNWRQKCPYMQKPGIQNQICGSHYGHIHVTP
jgi:hypothetical protein